MPLQPTTTGATATATTHSDAGHSRLTRRAQKRPKSIAPIRPSGAPSRSRIVVTRKPEIVKNTDTPMKPPGTSPGSPDVAPAWNSTTSVTAIARNPSSDGW